MGCDIFLNYTLIFYFIIFIILSPALYLAFHNRNHSNPRILPVHQRFGYTPEISTGCPSIHGSVILLKYLQGVPVFMVRLYSINF